MSQQQLQETAQKLLNTCGAILAANGYAIVTHDANLFSETTPDLAALKNGELLVFAVKAFDSIDTFMRAEQLNDIREELETVVKSNNLSADKRVQRVRQIALVMTPELVTVASEAGDIKWLVVSDFDQVPEQLDKVIV